MDRETNIKQKVLAYKPTATALDPIRDTPMLFLVGITGAGKNTILHKLMEKYPADYRFMVSHTTRAPRENHSIMERDGVEYHFVDDKQVERMLDETAFIEVQPVHAHIYGTSIAEVVRAKQENRIPVSDVDIKGVDYCVELGLNVKPIFILPPDYDTWFKRFTTRYGGNVHHHDLAVRMQSAIQEIEHALAVDYFYIVINDDLDKTVELVHSIAHGDPVEPHYHKAVEVAEHLLQRLHEEVVHVV